MPGFSSNMVSIFCLSFGNKAITMFLKGVQHNGCIVSPSLFSMYTESIMRQANVAESGVNIGGRKVSNLRYADDTALCASSLEELEIITQNVNRIGTRLHLYLNVKKTKFMTVGEDLEDANMNINREAVKKVQDFKYLGLVKA